jgi:SAM-dependent methyltransferase
MDSSIPIRMNPEKLQFDDPYAIEFFKSYMKGRFSDDAFLTEFEELCGRIREKALKVFPYNCIKYWKFVDLITHSHPCYNKVKENISRKKIIELGCCLGTDLRFLVHEGATISNVLGVEQYMDFINLGFELFGDYDRLKSNFLAANFFAPDFFDQVIAYVKTMANSNSNGNSNNDSSTKTHDNNDNNNITKEKNSCELFDVVIANSVFHLLNDEQCIKLVDIAYKLLAPGGIFLGQSVGSKDFIYRNYRKPNGEKYPLSPEYLYEILHQKHFTSIFLQWKTDKEPEVGYWAHFTFYGEKH